MSAAFRGSGVCLACWNGFGNGLWSWKKGRECPGRNVLCGDPTAASETALPSNAGDAGPRAAHALLSACQDPWSYLVSACLHRQPLQLPEYSNNDDSEWLSRVTV